MKKIALHLQSERILRKNKKLKKFCEFYMHDSRDSFSVIIYHLYNICVLLYKQYDAIHFMPYENILCRINKLCTRIALSDSGTIMHAHTHVVPRTIASSSLPLFSWRALINAIICCKIALPSYRRNYYL